MKISLDKTSSMFGLTYRNLHLPAMQKFLRAQGISITFPDPEHAVIEYPGSILLNSSFQEQVSKIDKSATNNVMNGLDSELNQCSWSVLNGFLTVLGSAAIATAFAILAGASGIVVAGIACGAGVGALAAYSLFHACSQDESDFSVGRLSSSTI
ncbi:MAG: hypothetical protein JJT82_08515 [Legionellaceae bacterium]|nr:hypothetical protein [Legionellaceae bacterium]